MKKTTASNDAGCGNTISPEPVMTEGQQAAHVKMTELRPQIFSQDGNVNEQVLRQYNQLSAYVHNSSPAPGWFTSNPSSESSMEKSLVYKPAENASDYCLEGHDPLTDAQQMERTRHALHVGGLSKKDGQTLWDEIIRLSGKPVNQFIKQGCEAIMRRSWGEDYDRKMGLTKAALAHFPEEYTNWVEKSSPMTLYSPDILRILANVEDDRQRRTRE